MPNTEELNHVRNPESDAGEPAAATPAGNASASGESPAAGGAAIAIDDKAGRGTPQSAPTRGTGGRFLPKSPDASAGARKRKRGRPPKSATSSGTATAPKSEKPKAAKIGLALDSATLARNLAFAHGVAAFTLRIPALTLTDTEAKKLAEAICELAAQYDIAISAKLLAWVQFLGTCAAIYGPRVMVVLTARKAGKAAREKQASSAAVAGAPKMDFSADVQSPGAVN